MLTLLVKAPYFENLWALKFNQLESPFGTKKKNILEDAEQGLGHLYF